MLTPISPLSERRGSKFSSVTRKPDPCPLMPNSGSSPTRLNNFLTSLRMSVNIPPSCHGACVQSSNPRRRQELVSDLTVGFGPFRETFTSRVTLDRPPVSGFGMKKGRFDISIMSGSSSRCAGDTCRFFRGFRIPLSPVAECHRRRFQ